MDYLIEVAVTALSKRGEELCGDRVVTVKNSDSTIVVLSDGLGSGVKANILATLTANIAATMLKKGALLDEVVETIGRTLPVCRVRKVAYSTFTIIQVFKDGNVYLAEFGNPALFHLHRGRIQRFDSQKREIAGKEIREARFTAGEGDILVAVSDGVVHAGIGVSLNLGWQWENVAAFLERIAGKENSAKGICSRLAEVTSELYRGVPGDDATVATVHIRCPRFLTVAVGPPVLRADDAAMAQMLASAKGWKVVCGGSTSKLIARELGRELKVQLDDFDRSIPPMGIINGIDLVSEGVITLSKVVESLRGNGEQYRGPNAVTLLRNYLVQSDEVHFLVGRARNPAYQNTDLPNESLKQQLISELCSLLEADGKVIRCTYF